MLQLYKNIKKLRLEQKMTQSDLAQKLGYTDKSMISKIERGEVDLSQSKIVSFANILGVTPGDLMGFEKPSVSDAALLADLVNDRLLMEAIIKLSNMSPEQKIKVYDYIDFQLYKTTPNDV